MALNPSSSEPTSGSDSDTAVDSDEDAPGERSDLFDTSSDITELDQSEFSAYFEERNNRLFHSHGNSPYPLPVDTYEQQRLNIQHALLRWLTGTHCRGPVRRVLSQVGLRTRVLDLCTGTGQWVLDMAHDYPHVRFDGIDIVPIATRTPPDNVYFEMADVNMPLRYNTRTFDLVHARSISMAVHDYPRVVDEVARILRPGGLFVACEWGRSAAMADNLDPAQHAPATFLFYQIVNETLRSRGIMPLAQRLESFIEASGQFERIRPRMYMMPVGSWNDTPGLQELGKRFRIVLVWYAHSMALMMIEAGRDPSLVNFVVGGFVHELFTVSGLICKYFTVSAIKASD
ncbi:S-adenosyl-L-methionine-dependent methyltransferase [Trametopsis cervina]|nr:S-adenosyl-L-methionine-dependent methyltransferase [Trametopsis cervina]